ncbi:MAG: hypothetical protein R3309_13950, partial [Reinekea sp.]|nr:hypothetical protein [Reinekea sp.]
LEEAYQTLLSGLKKNPGHPALMNQCARMELASKMIDGQPPAAAIRLENASSAASGINDGD